MKNFETITKLQNQLAELVQEEFNALKTFSLVPKELEEEESFYDWLYDCPILYKENKYGSINSFHIVDIVREDTGLKFIGRNTSDYRDTEEFSAFDFTLSDKIKLLNCINDILVTLGTEMSAN